MARILIIEDNEQNMYLTSFILESKGHTVVQARNGDEGIQLAQSEAPDLILLDVQLPVLDGYAVARRIREFPELTKVPIVAVTSHAMVGDRERVLEAGCIGYVEKPINPDTFVAEVTGYLAES